ncbi:MAG: HAD family hydrolase [Oliverpabstia sp.]|nr:HAD family hydrolase [Oliverpabstia sp.]
MKKTKAVFFDIDGTIWDSRNFIPESTIKAIHQLRANGHYTFLCSGRSRGYIQNPQLLGIGFDGIVSGCGTMIEYNDQVVYYKEIDHKLAEYTVNTVRKYGFCPILEGRTYLYMDDEEFENDFFGMKLKSELGVLLRTIKGSWGKWEISKLSCKTTNADTENCFKTLDSYFDFMIHNSSVVEMVPKGHHKGTGIQKVCEFLSIDLEDTVAFGDSANDIGMLHTAGMGVVMGNGSDVAKKAADYITSPLLEDGIWNACKHLELI